MGTRRWWALGALALSLLVVGLDLTVLNVALPTLSTDLHASTGQLQWFADAYNLVLAAVILPAGMLGDRFGRKRLLLGALVVFGWWQRRTDHPLVDLSLFRSASFTWGAVLATLTTFAMFGLLFAMPQYFQAVGGADSLGTGLRLLPIVGGLLVGARLSSRLAPGIGAKATVAVGFGLIAAGLAAGATTGAHSGYGYAAGWMAVAGAGLGFALPAAMDATRSALTAERSGVGSALVMALRQVGGTIGVALLGTVLNAGYRGRLDLAGLPGTAADTVRRSVSAGVATAERLGSVPMRDSVRAAFVHGMDAMLWVCGGVAVLGLVLSLAFLPRSAAGGQPAVQQPESGHDVVV